MSNNYISDAIRTESVPDLFNPEVSEDGLKERLLHAAIGMVTESGEFIDAIKKHLYYNKQLDPINLQEELGDVLWYVAIAMSALGTNFEAEMERNIAKLKTRYPEKFNSGDAINRDLDAERAILEG